jgi:hypothetical protein
MQRVSISGGNPSFFNAEAARRRRVSLSVLRNQALYGDHL